MVSSIVTGPPNIAEKWPVTSFWSCEHRRIGLLEMEFLPPFTGMLELAIRSVVLDASINVLHIFLSLREMFRGPLLNCFAISGTLPYLWL